MGFLSSFTSAVSSGFKSVTNTVGSGFKAVTNSVIKPAYNSVVKPVYNSVIKPVAERGISYVEHGIDRVERLADAGVKGAEGAGNFLDTIGKSPMLIIGVLALGAIVALKK